MSSVLCYGDCNLIVGSGCSTQTDVWPLHVSTDNGVKPADDRSRGLRGRKSYSETFVIMASIAPR